MDKQQEEEFVRELDAGIKRAKMNAWNEAVTALFFSDTISADVMRVMTAQNPYNA